MCLMCSAVEAAFDMRVHRIVGLPECFGGVPCKGLIFTCIGCICGASLCCPRC